MLFWVNKVLKQQAKNQKGKNKDKIQIIHIWKNKSRNNKQWEKVKFVVIAETINSRKNVKFVEMTSRHLALRFDQKKSEDIPTQFWSKYIIGLQ